MAIEEAAATEEKSSLAVCLDTMAGYKTKGVKHSFLEHYNDEK